MLQPPARLAAVALLALAAGCAQSNPPQDLQTPIACAPDSNCSCIQTCNYSCDGAGCWFGCNGTVCDFACPQGGCTAYASGSATLKLICGADQCGIVSTGAGTREVQCPGGGCSAYCSGADSCVISVCPHDCTLRCDGVPDGGCYNACDDGGTGCETYQG